MKRRSLSTAKAESTYPEEKSVLTSGTTPDLLAFVVAAISHRREPFGSHRFTRLLSHLVKLIPVSADVRDLMRHNQMMLGIHRGLYVVADNAGALALARHRSRVGVSQRDLAIGA